MNRKLWGILACLCTLAMMAASAVTGLRARRSERKTADVQLCRVLEYSSRAVGRHGKEQRRRPEDSGQALADGSIVGYGDDLNIVHTPDGMTHDDWWSAMSMAAMLNVLDKFYKSGTPTSPVLASATKHADGIFVSRYYNWRPGTYKGAYTRVGYYKLKPDAPEHAIETLSKSFIVPLLEKLLADGAIVEYEIDTEAVHTEAPGAFWIDVISPNAEGLDKLNAALLDRAKTNPMGSQAFDSMIDSSAHRDNLSTSTVTYK